MHREYSLQTSRESRRLKCLGCRRTSSEEPVREKLQETTISSTQNGSIDPASPDAHEKPSVPKDHGNDERGQNGHPVGPTAKKRGLDEDAEKPAEKRSRDKSGVNDVEAIIVDKGRDDADKGNVLDGGKESGITADKMEEDTLPAAKEDSTGVNGSRDRQTTPPSSEEAQDERMKDALASPKNKRPHEEFARDHESDGQSGESGTEAVSQAVAPTQFPPERATKRQKSQSPEPKGEKMAPVERKPQGVTASKVRLFFPSKSGLY
jgi:hypothetical protein